MDVSNGYTWVVNNFKSKLTEAKKWKYFKSLDSELFYISKYRFGVNLYLTGGNGNPSHVSLYVYLAGGISDGVLEWPFVKCVRITVLRQGQSSSNVNGLMRVTFLLEYSRKPCGQGYFNDGYGHEKFMAHADLLAGGFLKDGKIYLKMQLED